MIQSSFFQKYFLFLCVIFCCVGSIGCKKLLEVTPQSSITETMYFSNESDFDPNLVGIYGVMRELANNVTYGTERGEELVSAANSRFTVAWSQDLSPASGALSYADWYRGIGHCNLLLEKIKDFAFAADPDLKKRIIAETHALRAYFFFSLLRIIGDTPLMLQAISDENIPLLPRSDKKAVLQQVLNDLQTAIDQLKSMTVFSETSYPSKYRFSYGSVLALQADALLWGATVLSGGETSYQEVIKAVNEVEKTGLSLNDEFKNVTGMRAAQNKEVALAMYFQRDETPGGNYSKNALPFRSIVQGAINLEQLPYTLSSGNGQGAYQISALSKSLFTDSNDRRIPYTWIVEQQATGPKISWITKYPGTKYTDDRVPDNDIIIYRLSDLYLMKAEAYNGIGDFTNAVLYLNKVKARAGLAPYSGVLSRQPVAKEILDERGRELFFENKRWYDLLRFYKAGVIDLYSYIPNLKGKTTPIYWPLNTTVLGNNPNLKQTEGY